MSTEVIHSFIGGESANVISEETTRVNRISSFGTANSSSSSQVVPSEDTDVGNDQMVTSEMELSGDIIHHVISSADESHNEEAVPVPVPVAVVPLALIPSLRGKLVTDGALNVCRGVWAMSDAAHDIPEHTSDFEFKLMKAAPDSIAFPYSGKYQGWFTLKQPPPIKGTIKIEDRDMFIKFCPNGDGTFKVEGNGTNKFGKFTLRGALGTDHMMQIYREYQYKLLASPRKRPVGCIGANLDGENGKLVKPYKKKMPLQAVPAATIDGVKIDSMGAFREGAGRARKPSSIIKDPDDPILAPKLPTKAVPTLPFKAVLPQKVPVIPTQVIKTESSGRAQRPPPQMQKCSDLLKDLMKMPQAIWFSEPVDPIKMNVPDYPTLIKQPMDFGTVRANLDKGVYDTPEALADHIRLTFRNAITYNQMRDNPVHIAAREMAGRFEEKFRMMLTQLSSGSYAQEEMYENKVGRPVGSGGGRKSGSLGGAKVKTNGAQSVHRQRSMGGAGPRPIEQTFFPQTMVDSSAQTMLAMQRQMEAMSSELKLLRTKVMQSEVKHDMEVQRDAAQNPLTFQEKKSLISKIHQLPASKMQQVVDLIKDAIPPEKRGEGDEIEIPLDELDTFTLRKLQAFVEEHSNSTAKKKSNIASKENAVAKKPRKEKSATLGRPPGSAVLKKIPGSSSSASVSSQGQYLGGGGGSGGGENGDRGVRGSEVSLDAHGGGGDHMDPLGDSIEEDDLFFSNESFDDLRAQAQENGTMSDASENEEDMVPAYSSLHSSTRHHEESGQFSPQSRSHKRSRSDSLLSDEFDEILAVKSAGHWQTVAGHVDMKLSSPGGTLRNEDGRATDIWNNAASEMEAKRKREAERKLDEERNAELRDRREAERMAIIHEKISQDRADTAHRAEEANRQKEQEILNLQQRREDERVARENMAMTANLTPQCDIDFGGDADMED